jgi:hypothetical protein
LFSGVPPVFAPFSFSAHISYILGVYFACGKVGKNQTQKPKKKKKKAPKKKITKPLKNPNRINKRLKKSFKTQKNRPQKRNLKKKI